MEIRNAKDGSYLCVSCVSPLETNHLYDNMIYNA